MLYIQVAQNTLLMIGVPGIIPDIKRVQLRQLNERGWRWPQQSRFYEFRGL